MSLRARVSWLVGLTVALLLVALGTSVQLQSARTLRDAVDEDLRAIARTLTWNPRADAPAVVPRRDRFGGAPGLTQLVTADGRVLADLRPRSDGDRGTAVVPLPVGADVLAVAAGTRDEVLRTVRVVDPEVAGTADDGEPVRLRMLVVPLRPGVALQVARPLDEVEGVVAALRVRTALLTLVGALVAALVAWLVAGRAVAPVRTLTAAVEDVRETRDLARRIDVPDTGDEVARLAAAFDAMLARLEAARAAQDRFAADASHELRTPLTSLRTNVEVLAAEAGRLSVSERAQLVDDVVGQLDELTAMVDGLVTITRVDADAAVHAPVDVADVAREVVAAARRRHPQRTADLTVTADTDGCTVDGDVRELTLAVSALVDNAVKYAPEGTIEVTVRRADASPHVHLTVSDHGPGVDAASLPHLFERFYRAPSARSAPGAGLGLALVERVASAHGGTVSARADAPEGLQVTLTLPARRSDPDGRPAGGASGR